MVWTRSSFTIFSFVAYLGEAGFTAVLAHDRKMRLVALIDKLQIVT